MLKNKNVNLMKNLCIQLIELKKTKSFTVHLGMISTCVNKNIKLGKILIVKKIVTNCFITILSIA